MYALLSDDIWLPGNLTWSDLEKGDSEKNVPSIVLSLPFAILILVLRYSTEKFCLLPIGRRMSIREARTKSSPNPVLEHAYVRQKKFDYKQLRGLAKQVDWSESEVERWMRIRARVDKPTTMDKFCESSWRFIYYTLVFGFGLVVLWNKPWLWNIKECWRTYPYEPRTLDIYFYYSISLAFYYALFVSQFFDVKRKDFWQMFLHHLATITLLITSWCCRLHAIGTLILLLHDFADIFLEATKITKYCGFQTACQIIFAIFSLCWVLSRTIVFPLWIIKSTAFDVLDYQKPYPGWLIFNCFLSVLFLLHIFWTYQLMRLIYRVIKAGEVVDDVRSDSESND